MDFCICSLLSRSKMIQFNGTNVHYIRNHKLLMRFSTSHLRIICSL
nr:MAG TPA: hypothetical protein [Caudoviricetes sp.]